MKFYLIRHPRTKRNKEFKLTGWEQTEYTKTGKKQFSKILDHFKNFEGKIYSSDLPRCLKLAQAISDVTNIKINKSKLLRERNFKETKPLHHHETSEDFQKRVNRFLKKHNPKNSIIVTHSGTTKEIIRSILSKKELEEIKNTKRNVVFEIKTNRKVKKLKKIDL